MLVVLALESVNNVITRSSVMYTCLFSRVQGYFNSFCIEKIGTNVACTLVCPGPVQSNILSECYTEKPGEVSASSY